jgi:hypothetical protein
VGDTVQVTADHPRVGTWSYAARILWIRAGHLGLSPPEGLWRSLVERDGRLALHIQQARVTATLITRAVGVTQDLPPVLVVRQEVASTPVWHDGSIAIERKDEWTPIYPTARPPSPEDSRPG